MSLLRQLHAASLPFVTRALRGGRRNRYAAGAVLLALLTVMLGFWISLGHGRLEHELRSSLHLERPMYMQEMIEGKIFADDADEVRRLERQLAELRDPQILARLASRDSGNYRHTLRQEWRVVTAMEQGVEAVLFAADTPVQAPQHADLQRRARSLKASLGLANTAYDSESAYLNWYNPDDVARVRYTLDSGLHPVAMVYASPLGVPDAVRLTGMLAGGITLLLLMLFTPVLAGTQMAQEVHENTLQPLTGTSLGARDLVLGMTVAPLVVVGLVAAPQIVLLLGAALITGTLSSGLATLGSAIAGGLFLTMLAQLAGLALGRQRTPGLVGVGLLGALVPLTMLGAALALDLPHNAAGVLALLPQGAAAWLLTGTFVPSPDPIYALQFNAELTQLWTSVVVGALGMLSFAWLGLRALERRIGDLAPAALTRFEALFGALVSVVLISLAHPWSRSYNDDFYLVNLALASIPFAILLMMRVPQGDVPVALRRVPVAPLVGEFAAMVGLLFAIDAAIMGPDRMDIVGSPVALAYMTWSVVVAALLAIRVAALPVTLVQKLWLGVCSVGLIAAYAHAAYWTEHEHASADDIFALWQVSPLLGALQIVLLFAIPITLVRALQRPASVSQPEA